ncbi:MAG: EAL domain-containing protein [Gammaproteobacteria bacterium]|nr:EAL domain-containing protein [Gammaproteobacteria bacterium]
MDPETSAARFGMALRSIDFSKYSWLVRAGLTGALAVVVCDLKGKRIWALTQNSQGAYAPALAALNNAVPDWPFTGRNIRRCSVSETTSAYITSICDVADNAMAGIFVLVDQSDSALDYNTLSSSIHRITKILAVEIAQQSELNAMGDELLQRYEELNLIYNTQDNIKYFDEGQDALRNLVKRSAEYLDSAICMILMADRKLIIPHIGSNAHALDYAQVVQIAKTEVYDQVAYRKTSMIHNDDAEHRHIFKDLSCKMLATPIFDENSEVIGVVLLANNQAANDFTGSDHKLLGLMAHKASRIIQVNYDSLSGMMTRNGFEYHLETALYVVRYKRIAHCVLNINVDRLHVVNDTSGHHAGDELIKRVSAVIRDCLDENDVVSRLGGGEFGVLLTDKPIEQGELTAEKIRDAVSKIEFSWDNRRYPVSVSIGVAPMEPDTNSIISLLSFAELACSAAKDLGRDRVQLYQNDNTMLIRRQAQIHWLGRLHTALREDEFELFAQPIRSVNDPNGKKHTEILLRLADGNEGLLSPAEFINAAERYNLMPAIDRWVVRNTLKMLMANLPSRLLNDSTWAINLSGQTISDGNFLKFIDDEVERTGINPSCLCFEITETAAVTNIRKVTTFMEQMKHQGFRFSLDDFGTGLSSFAYLKTLPVDYLKIDGAFVKEVATDRVSASMVRAISQIGKEMGLHTIAEFVENDAILQKLGEMGVDYAQGYHVGKPAPLMERLVEFTAALGSPQTVSEQNNLEETVVNLQVGG